MATTQADSGLKGRRRRVRGMVASVRMQKTIVVEVLRRVQHPDVEKIVRRVSVFKAHDERREARTGDEVEIEETRPLSKTKRWRLTRVIRSAGEAPALVPGALSVEAVSQAHRQEREREDRGQKAPSQEPSQGGTP